MHIQGNAESEGNPSASLTQIDRLNAQNMRWRLRRDMGNRGLEARDQLQTLLKLESDRLWEILAGLGKVYGLGRARRPASPEDENIAAGLYLKLKAKWDVGELRYFKLAYLQKAAEEHLAEHDHARRGRGDEGAGPIPDVKEIPGRKDTAPEREGLVELRDVYSIAFAGLDSEEAYLLGAYIGSSGAQGYQRQAAQAISKDDQWGHRVKKRLFAKLRRHLEPADGREADGDDLE